MLRYKYAPKIETGFHWPFLKLVFDDPHLWHEQATHASTALSDCIKKKMPLELIRANRKVMNLWGHTTLRGIRATGSIGIIWRVK